MHEHHAILREIVSIYLEEDHNHLAIRKATRELKQLFFAVTGLPHTGMICREDIKLDSGKAINIDSAAACIDDMMRTKIFMKGLHDAIHKKMEDNPAKPVLVLYAGTGPFATLFTPLTTVFSPSQLQVILLEINPVSIMYLHKTIDAFNLKPYIRGMVATDASVYEIPAQYEPDIILSETMKWALEKEPQVSIFLNLARQRPGALLIPQEIKIELAFIGNASKGDFFQQPIARLMELNAASLNKINKDKPGLSVLSGSMTLQIEKPAGNGSCQLAYLTFIRVFNNNCLNLRESGLTIPRRITDFLPVDKWPVTVRVQYHLGSAPGFSLLKM
jgi:hypothetical protein